jgi:hypothetical protein
MKTVPPTGYYGPEPLDQTPVCHRQKPPIEDYRRPFRHISVWAPEDRRQKTAPLQRRRSCFDVPHE